MEKEFQKNILAKWLWLILATFLLLPGCAKADTYSANELDTLVSTIALYPDPLLAHVLNASTHKEEIPSASLWANAHKGLKGEALTAAMEQSDLDYDPSVLALIPFPTVLATMAKYSAWTAQLGDAVTNQNGEVMFAVQRMRHAAYDNGNLKTDQYVKVNRDVYITIEPVKTQYVYVPVYNPSVVYYVHSDRYVPMRYGYGVWVGHWYSDWTWNDSWFEWHSYTIRHHPRPPRHHHHAAPPPRREGSIHAPAPRPRGDHQLPAKYTTHSVPNKNPAKVAPKREASYPEAPRPAYSNDNNQYQEGTFSNSLNLTKHPKGNSSNSGSSNNDNRKYEDRRNGSYSESGSRDGGNGGFHKSIRR